MKMNSYLIIAFLLMVSAFAGIALPVSSSVGSIAKNDHTVHVENTWVAKEALPQGGAVFGAAAVGGRIYAFGEY
jgi:hypothetical protein